MTTSSDPPTDAESNPALQVLDFDVEPLFLVDDDEAVLESLRRSLVRAGYRVRAFADPEEALAEIRHDAPKVLVTDKKMPGMDGLELAERALNIDPETRIIIITGAGDEQAAQAALRLGATDYVTKPVDVQALAQSVHRAYRAHASDKFDRVNRRWLREQVRQRTEEIREVSLGAIASLMNALEARTPQFKGHSERVADCAEGIARALKLPEREVELIGTAGLLHDVGMIAVPDAIVEKPGDLSPEEHRVIQGHCEKGVDILEPLMHVKPSIRYILEHHERLDGSGYPEGKRGREISLGGQIVGLAESWTAMTEDRPYRDRMSEADAFSTLVGVADLHYSGRLIEALRTSL